MAKKLTRFILLALVLGIVVGWVLNATIDDGTPASAERLKTIAGGIDLVTLTSQNVGQEFTEDVFVVDHKDALLSHRLRETSRRRANR